MKHRYLFGSILLMVLMMAVIPLRAQDAGIQGCTLTVQTDDQYGDGWNDAILSFYSQGVHLGSFSPSNGSTETYTFTAPSDSVRMMWTKGHYDDECQFTIWSEDGTVLYSSAFGNMQYVGDNYGDTATFGWFVNVCPSCFRPNNLRLLAATETSLTLTWNWIDSVEWQVLLCAHGATPDWDSAQTVQGNQVTYTDLLSSTPYDVYVRSLCDHGNDTSQVASFVCMTDCSPSLCQYTIVLQDNNNYGFLKNAIEVVNEYGLAVDTVYINLSDFSGTEARKMVSYCPGKYYLRWLPLGYQYSYYYSNFNVQVLDAEDEGVLSFYISSKNLDEYLDSFTFQCPTCFPPAAVGYVAHDSTSVTLNWGSTGDGVTYLIEYGPEGYVDGTRVAVTDTFITLTGLSPDTRYEGYIGTLCTDGDTSRFREFGFQPGPRLLNRIYVAQQPNRPDWETGDGASWSTSYTSIAEAQYSAYEQGRLYGNHPDIWVAQGVYYENLTVLPSQHIYGGFVGDEAADYDVTQRDWFANMSVIDGAWNGPCLVQEEPFTAATQSSFDGFVIGGGQVDYGTAGVALKAYTVIRNCQIENSRAVNQNYLATALFSAQGDPDNIITVAENCSFCYGLSYGSSIYLENARIDNSLIHRNQTLVAAVELGAGGSIRHCDVVNNNLLYYWSDGRPVYAVKFVGASSSMVNSIVYGNIKQDYQGEAVWATSYLVNLFDDVSYCALNGEVSGTGNISLDTLNNGTDPTAHYPVFVDLNTDDYRINLGSACIDAGTTLTDISASDYAGNARVVGAAPDMGCYENDGTRICMAPYYVWIEKLSAGVVAVYWEGMEVDSYEMSYCVAGSGEWTVVGDLHTYSDTLSGLAENTEYMVRVRAICGDTPTSYSDTVQFNSGCFNPIDAVYLGSINYTNTNLPVTTSWPMSMSYSLVTAAELDNMPRTIDTIGFYLYTTGNMTRHWKIAIIPTDFDGNLSMDSLGTVTAASSGQDVFNGEVTMPNYSGWFKFPLQQSFNYDGHSNLVIAVMDSTEGNGVESRFFVHPTDHSSFVMFGYSMESMSSYYSTNYRPHVYFNANCDTSSCPRPRMAVAQVTDSSITVEIIRLTGNPLLEYSSDNGATWTACNNFINDGGQYGLLTGLDGNTHYQIRLRGLCEGDDTSMAYMVNATTNPSPLKHIYVRADAPAGGNGSSWQKAYRDINEAVTMAAGIRTYYNYYPDVRVAAGIYYGDTSEYTEDAFFIQDPVSIHGGFAGNEPDDYDLSQRDFAANATILDGMGMRRVLKLNPYNNNWVDSIPVYDGLTLRNGDNYQGAGLFIDHHVLIDHCRIENCGYSYGWYGGGGGIYFYSDGNTVRNTVVTRCYGAEGSGIYSNGHNRIENCEISYCYELNPGSSGGQGALRSYYDTVLNCRFFNDTSFYYSAIRADNSYFENCLVWNNYAYSNSAVYSNYCTFVSCDIVQNTTQNASGYAVGFWDGYNSTVSNSIIWGNRDLSAASAPQVNGGNITYSAIEGGYEGEGNIALASENIGVVEGLNYPYFALPTEGDYRLMNGSPCINNGKDTLVRLATDLAGNLRVIGDTIDMGCMENDGTEICVPPFSLTAEVSSTNALISWNTLPSTTGVTLEYRIAGDDNWTSIEDPVGGSYMLSGLQGSTTYEYQMRGLCEDGTHSGWSSVKTFTTECTDGSFIAVAGDTTSTGTSNAMPWVTGYEYNYYTFAQQLFLKSELNQIGFIDTLRFQLSEGLDIDRTVRIYLGTTEQEYMQNYYPILLEDQTLVYEGTVNMQGENGWLTLPLQQPFEYDGRQNLVLTTMDVTGEANTSSSVRFNYTYCNSPRALGSGSSSPITVATNYYYNTYYYHNNVQFSMICANSGCARPLLSVGDVTDSSATLHCQTGEGIELQYRIAGDDNYTDLTPAVSLPLTGLQQNTAYEVRTRTVCGNGDTSQWRQLTFSTLPSRLTRYYVTVGGTGKGSSWSDATGDLNQALRLASASQSYYHQPVDVWVAGGTYYGGFEVIEGINVYGGFAGNEAADCDLSQRDLVAHATILDGRDSLRVLNQPHTFSQSTLWDGFTVQHGYHNSQGGGIYMMDGFHINRFTITDCHAYSEGGGIYIATNNAVIENSLVTRCSAQQAAGIRSQGSRIQGTVVSRCRSEYNYGAISSSDDTIRACRFVADTADYYTCFFYRSFVENSLIAGNRSEHGSIVRLSSDVRLVGCDIVGNTVVDNNSSEGYYIIERDTWYSPVPTVVNSIIWGNRLVNTGTASRIHLDSVSYCAVEGGFAGTGNIALSPLNDGNDASMNYPVFVQPDDGDYRLMEGSACIDAGRDSLGVSATDILGNARRHGEGIDMGCYENDGTAICVYPNNIRTTVSSTAAVISWTLPRSAVNVDLEYHPAGVDGWIAVEDITAGAYMIENLQPTTTYEYRLACACDENTTSSWSPVKEFTTECASGNSVVMTGDTASKDNYSQYYPFRSSDAAYGFSQQIFLQSEIGETGVIDTLRFQLQRNCGYDRLRHVQFYLGHTTQNNYNNDQRGIPMEDMTLVFDDTINLHTPDNDWLVIPLQTPFNYNGRDNLVLTSYDRTGEAYWTGMTYYFYYEPNYNSMTLYAYSYYDDEPIEMGGNTTFSTSSSRNVMLFSTHCGNNGCARPLLAVSDVTDSSATLSCQTGASVELQYRAVSAATYTDLPVVQSQTLVGLIQNTAYEVRTRTVCGQGDTSEWRSEVFTTQPKHQSRFYVAMDGTGDGSSWTNATGDLKWALNTAKTVHETFGTDVDVWVAGGVYYGLFNILEGINVYGGFAGDETADYDMSLRNIAAHPTILDGENRHQVLYQSTSFTSNNTLWDGFTVRNGWNVNAGGGIVVLGGTHLNSFTVTDCYSGNSGGGIRAQADNSNYPVIITNSIISRDSASEGGGIYASYYVRMENVLVNNNVANGSGGGVYSYYAYETWSGLTVVNNKLESNNNGSGIYYYGYNPIYNSIIWGNRNANGNADNQINSTSNIYNSAIENLVNSNNNGNVILGSANDTSIFSPRFVAPTEGAGLEYSGGDWRLQQGSVCINRGNSNYATMSTDLAGDQRIQKGVVDMGCYESAYDSVAMPQYGNIIYVKMQAEGNGVGSSWENAMNDINMAQRVALANGVPNVWVAEGVYYGDGESTLGAFTMMHRVSVYGGFAGTEPDTFNLVQRNFAEHATILDGANLHRVLYCESGTDYYATWDGFTLRNGNATQASNSHYGGGAYLQGRYQLVNCVVTGNTAYNGGGIYTTSSGYKTVTINGQSYRDYYNKVVNCTIKGNTATNSGGGVYINNALLSNSLIVDNTASCYGGGVYNYYCYVVNNTIVGNKAGSSYYGGGNYSQSSTYANNIIWGNKKGYVVDNSYFYSSGNTVGINAIEGGYSGTGSENVLNLESTNDGSNGSKFYVRFVDPMHGDYALHSTSPCINFSDTVMNYCLPQYDIAGNARFVGEIADLGCYETNVNTSCPSVIGVIADNVTSSSATVSWSPMGSETSWSVRYVQDEGDFDSTFLANDTIVMLTDLQLNRTYSVYVRALCDTGGVSLYSIPATFSTLCDTTLLTPLNDITSMICLQMQTDSVFYTESLDFSWTSMPMATSYDFYFWKAGEEEPTVPTRKGLTTAGLNNFQVPQFSNNHGSVFYWKVVVWNECINKVSATQTLQEAYLPNLHVSGFTLPDRVAAKQTITIEWTVVNDGQGSTPPGSSWYDYIYITGHNGVGGGYLYYADETELAVVPNLKQLAPGESYTNSVQVTIPQEYLGGYYFFVMADQHCANNINYAPTGDTVMVLPYTPSATGTPYPYLTAQTTSWPGNCINSVLVETMEGDNFFYKMQTILPPPTPDLHVTNINHPLNAYSGDTIQVKWQVTNEGDAAAMDSWNDAVYLSQSADSLDFNTALLLGTAHHDGALNIEATYTDSIMVVLPLPLNGPYYVYVKSDITNAVFESIYEANNIEMSDQTMNVIMAPPADLAVTNVSMITYDASTLGSFDVMYTVTNVGARAVTDVQWRDVVYISAVDTFDASASRIGVHYHQTNLGIGESYSPSVQITIPDGIDGIRYIYVKTDVDNDVFEYTYEDNNTLRMQFPLHVYAPDLQIQWVQVPTSVTSDGTDSVIWRVVNMGKGEIASRFVTNSLVFYGETLSTHSQYVTLDSGQYVQYLDIVTLPCHNSSAVVLGAVADKNGNIFESNETNNGSSVDITVVTPDLVASNLMVPDTLWSGTTVTASWTLKNIGQANVDAVVTDRFYLGNATSYQSTDSMCRVTRQVTLAAGDSITEVFDLAVPNGVQGQRYVHQVVNATGTVCEGDNAAGNHTVSNGCDVILSPYPDLVVLGIVPPASANIGETFVLNYTIGNQGTGSLNGKDVTTRFYISPYTTFNTNTAKMIGDDVRQMALAVDGQATYEALVRIPTEAGSGLYYVYAVVDATDAVYEYLYEHNNTTRTNSQMSVDSYPLDLAVTAIAGRDTVDWGGRYTYGLTVTNMSQVPTLASYWSNRLYLSQDPVLQDDDMMMADAYWYRTLEADSSYTVLFSFQMPYGYTSPVYLIGVADPSGRNPETSTVNNILVRPVEVNMVPSGDLAVTAAAVVEESVYSGQWARIAYTVTNVGEVAATGGVWLDKVFLSANDTYEASDVEIGSTGRHETTLAPGESYTDTLGFRVPLPQNGTVYIVVRANSGNHYYESNMANNSAAALCEVLLPQPGDLVVNQIAMDGAVVSGDTLNVSWKVKNVGDNTLTGDGLRSLAYLSTNTTFDADDRLLGSVDSRSIDLIPGDEIEQQMASRISGLPEGEYYVLVKTDVSNVFNEVDDDNNTGCSAYPFTLTVRTLPFNTSLEDTLYNDLANDYKLVVDTNTDQTVRVHLQSEDNASGAVNMLFVSHNTMGSTLGYDFSSTDQFTHNPELYIPATEAGYYGVNVQGSTPTAASQPVTIRADILPFELRAVNPAQGGNTGRVTVMLTGSRFSPNMDVTLTNTTGAVIYPVSMTYDSYYKAYVTFDLNGEAEGLYDVNVTHPTEGVSTLQGGFRIVQGTPENLYTNLVFPQSPRPNRVIVAMLEYGNVGNTDIVDASVTLNGIGEAPISLTPAGLTDGHTTLTIPCNTDDAIHGVLRPGARGYVNVYVNTTDNMAFYVSRELNTSTTGEFVPTVAVRYNEMTAVVTKPESCALGADGEATVMMPVNLSDTNYAFTWTTADAILVDTVRTISGLVSGGYYVTVMERGDISGIPVYQDFVYVDRIDTCNRLRVNLSSTCGSVVCEIPSVETYATAMGGTAPYTYSWSTRRYSVTGSGRYEISCRVVDAEGRVAYGTRELYLKKIECAVDPNEIDGPEGYDETLRYVAASEKMNYSISFENDPDFATAPATRVSVVYPIPDGQSISSVRLSDFGFGDHVFSVPENSTTYSKRLDVSSDLGVWVDVTAGIDILNNQVYWVFQSIDPATGFEPASSQMGFLSVNDSLGHGEGYVSFMISPKAGRVTGDTVAAEATIVFDENAPIATNVWKNTFDAVAPTSMLMASTVSTDSTYCQFTFTAADDNGGSGVDHVELYVAENDGAYVYFASCPADSSLRYQMVEGIVYRFISMAVDHVGNRETLKAMPDTVINNSTAPTDILLTATSFRENSELATVIGRLTTVDNDITQPFVYELVEGEGAADNAMFAIANGRLVTDSNYNCDGRSNYNVRIRTTDVTGLTYEKAFVLSKVQENYPASTLLTDAICNGESFTFGGRSLTTQDVYVDSLHTVMGCDSVVTLNLTVHPTYNLTDIYVVCDSMTWFDTLYTASTNTPSMTLITVNGCDSVINLNLTVNYSNAGVFDTSVCDTYTWLNGQTYTASNNTDTIMRTNAAGCDSTVTLNLTMRYSTAGVFDTSVCDTYTWPLKGQTYTTSNNTDTVMLTNAAQCDSTLTLNLTVRYSTASVFDTTVCDSYTWPLKGQNYTVSNNTDTVMLTNAAQCDSTVTLNLTVNNSNTGVFDTTVCDTYTWLNGQTYTVSNNTDTIMRTNAAGCDSTVTLSLTVNYSTASVFDTSVCDTYIWPLKGQTYTISNNTDTVMLTNAAQCDSIVTLNLTVRYSTASVFDTSVCDNYTWPLKGQTYTVSNNTDTVMLTNAAQCDSTVTLNLTVRYSTASVYDTTVCDSYTWLNGQTYTSSNNTDTVMRINAAQCDSTVTLNLTLNYSNASVFDTSVCDIYTWPLKNLTYTASNNTDTAMLTNVAGCDSTVTLNLTVRYSTSSVFDTSVCDSFTWLNGQIYTASNNVDTIIRTNAAQCDSTVTLNLTVRYSTASVFDTTVCDSYTWPLKGQTYTVSNNTDTVVLTNVAQCDSTVTLNLTLNHSNTGVFDTSVCDTYTWLNGLTYTASNNTDTIMRTNSVGCDSTVTLNLTVRYSNTGDTAAVACDQFIWYGTAYTASTDTPTHTTTNVAGCDSVTTLHLTVNYSTTGDTTANVCDVFTWYGSTYTASGDTATYTATNAVGCDSTVTLHLTVRYSTSYADEHTACDSYTWIDGQTYTASNNEAMVVVTNAAGCDSTVTLNLTINYSAEVTIEETAVNTYLWQGDTLTESGTYTWNGLTEAGCDSTVTLILVVEHTGIDNVNNPEVHLYPNPTRGLVTVEADGLESIEIYDQVGRKVYTTTGTNRIDFSTFSAGTYTLRIRHAGGVSIKRVVRTN